MRSLNANQAFDPICLQVALCSTRAGGQESKGWDALRPDAFRRARSAAQARGGAQPPGPARSPAEGEHGEDGEHRTLGEASTVARQSRPSGRVVATLSAPR